jgi:hypothetical protein
MTFAFLGFVHDGLHLINTSRAMFGSYTMACPDTYTLSLYRLNTDPVLESEEEEVALLDCCCYLGQILRTDLGCSHIPTKKVF